MTADNTDNVGQSQLVTLQEAAAILEKSERTIHRMLSSGKLSSVDIGGKKYIQLAGVKTPADTSETSDKTVKVTAKQDIISDELKQQYKDTIRRLEEENARLWNMVQSMLPPPASPQAKRDIPLWLFILLCVLVILVGVLWIYSINIPGGSGSWKGTPTKNTKLAHSNSCSISSTSCSESDNSENSSALSVDCHASERSS